MPQDISQVASALGSLVNVVLVSPSQNQGLKAQQSTININGVPTTITPSDDNFLFNFEGEQKFTAKSDITDHFAEDNNSLQDQIALPPPMYTTQGFICELTDIPPSLLAPLKKAANTLTTIDAFVPALSVSALIAYNQAFQAAQVTLSLISSVNNTIGTISNFLGGNGSTTQVGSGIFGPVQNKQQVAFQKLYNYYVNRTLFTVQTPWCIFKNMAIDTLAAVQSGENQQVTDFQITFKAMRFAQNLFADVVSGFNSNTRGAAQAAGLVNNGVSTGGPPVPFPGAVV